MIGDVTVNLIDTPGHPDFIAEVERVLGVLDGAVLVVSAVEGVQPQTRVLMRALRRLRIPTLLFVNKIDRAGADAERVLRAIADRAHARDRPDGTVARGRHPRRRVRAARRRTDAGVHDGGWPRSSPTTTTHCSPPTSTDRPPSPPTGPPRRSAAQTGRALVHPVSAARRSPARASTR